MRVFLVRANELESGQKQTKNNSKRKHPVIWDSQNKNL